MIFVGMMIEYQWALSGCMA